jgi:hypothetical protein
MFSVAHPMKGIDGSSLFLSVGKTNTSPQIVAAVTSQLASSTAVSTSNILAIPEQQRVDILDIFRLSSM